MTRTALHHRLLAALLCVLTALLVPGGARAQGEPDDPEAPPETPATPPTPPPANVATTVVKPQVAGAPMPADFTGALQTLRAPPGANGPAGAGRPPEIFPDASRVWMSVRDTDPLPIENARRGGPWLCASGQCTTSNGDPGRTDVGDDMLRSIKLQTPTLPLPLTLWGRLDSAGRHVLDFDPVLLGRRSYAHVCAYKPLEDATDPKVAGKKAEKVVVCHDGAAAMPTPDSAEITLGFEWPKRSELADFRYIAIVDSCGNARVQPFQRTFTVSVFEVASGGCGQADGKVLRIFPQGGWMRITGFNLDAPAASNVVNATYRVSVPPLENMVESSPARLLFPDPLLADLKVDCGSALRKAEPDATGIPQAPPGVYEVPPGAVPQPGAPTPTAEGNAKSLAGSKGSAPATPPGGPSSKPGATPPPATKPSGTKPVVDPKAPPKHAAPPPIPARPPPKKFEPPPSGPGPQPLAHQSVVIAPEPLRQGNCRIALTGQTKRRLVAPLALHVSLTRTDRTVNGAPIELLPDGKWIVTPNSAEFLLPPLAENFDGDSRLRLVVSADPLSGNGKVVLLSDAGRVASALRAPDAGEADRARRVIGSVVIHSVPLCGELNFETLEGAGSCLRAYVTIPAMLATLQITRAPWIERPLITRSVLSAVGVALAFDSYDPVKRRAFPVAAQIGGFIEQLGEGRLGMLAYLGVAPTIPILGSGGNTTTLGFLAGAGVAYVTNQTGPDEGVKPAAFVGAVVQIGQANPAISGSTSAAFGTGSGQ